MNNTYSFSSNLRIMLLILCMHHLFAGACTSPTYMLDLNAPNRLDTAGIHCLYHGVPLTFKDKYCILPETTARSFFVLVITPRVDFIKKGLFTSLQRVENLPCLWFLLTLEPLIKTDGAPSYTWQIEKLAKSEMPLRIPDHSSIIICIDPAVIKDIKSSQTGTRVIHLPSICLNESLTQKRLNASLEESCCFLPELRTHCAEEKCVYQCTNKTAVTQTEKPSC